MIPNMMSALMKEVTEQMIGVSKQKSCNGTADTEFSIIQKTMSQGIGVRELVGKNEDGEIK